MFPSIFSLTNSFCRVAVFNCIVWDFCSLLWRNSPFPTGGNESADTASNMSILFTDLNPTTFAKLCEHSIADEGIQKAFSITHGAVFAQYASEFLRSRHKSTTVTADCLKGKLKQEYLDFLKRECGMEGVYAFLVTFIGSLAKREGRKKASQP